MTSNVKGADIRRRSRSDVYQRVERTAPWEATPRRRRRACDGNLWIYAATLLYGGVAAATVPLHA